MIYYYISSAVIALISLGALISFAVIKKRKTAFILSFPAIVLPVLGVIVSLISVVSFRKNLTDSALKDRLASWAKDSFSSYLKGVCLISGIIMVLCVLSFFLKPRQKYIRSVLIFLTVTAILAATPVFAFLSSDDSVDISRCILLSGTGVSLITLFPLFFDYHRLSEEESSTENNK